MNRSINGLKIVKIAGGTLLSILLAEQLGLNYAASAGVITLLSIHDTKRETFRVMGKRMAAFLMALLLAPVCFYWLGYRPAAVGLFLLLFTPACTFLRMQEGISVSTVLLTHFLSEGSMSWGNIVNEILLLLVGVGVGMVMNLYIPGRKRLIRLEQHRIEEQFRLLLANMAGILDSGTGAAVRGPDRAVSGLERAETDRGTVSGAADFPEYQDGFAVLEEMLEQGERDAYRDMENRLLNDTRYYLSYMALRKSQLMVLRRIQFHLGWSRSFPVQASDISALFASVSRSFHEYNNAEGLLDELEQVKMQMRQQPLPVTREEFEARAVLFQILLELEQFLIMKREFVKGLSRQDIRMFWNTGENIPA